VRASESESESETVDDESTIRGPMNGLPRLHYCSWGQCPRTNRETLRGGGRHLCASAPAVPRRPNETMPSRPIQSSVLRIFGRERACVRACMCASGRADSVAHM
jgi:hypothetical protein